MKGKAGLGVGAAVVKLPRNTPQQVTSKITDNFILDFTLFLNVKWSTVDKVVGDFSCRPPEFIATLIDQKSC